jgi:hypothetical protein
MVDGGSALADFDPYEPPEVNHRTAIGFKNLFVVSATALLVFSASLICVLGTLMIGLILWQETYVKRHFEWGTIRDLVPLPVIAACVAFGLLIAMITTRAVVQRVLSRLRLLSLLSSRRAEMREQLQEYRKSVSGLRS